MIVQSDILNQIKLPYLPLNRFESERSKAL